MKNKRRVNIKGSQQKSSDMRSLRHVSEELKGNEKLAYAAVAQNANTRENTTFSVDKSQKKSNNNNTELEFMKSFKYVDEKSKKDKNIIKAILAQNTERKLAVISQPIEGRTNEEIRNAREKAIAFLESKGYYVLNDLFEEGWYSKEKMKDADIFIMKSFRNMSFCVAAYLCKGWESSTICDMEHTAAKCYELKIIYEE